MDYSHYSPHLKEITFKPLSDLDTSGISYNPGMVVMIQ